MKYLILLLMFIGLPCWAQSDMKNLEKKVDDATAIVVNSVKDHGGYQDLGIVPEDNIAGFGYNYNKIFPLGFSVASTWWEYMYGAVNIGFNLDGKNYSGNGGEINPIMYFSVEPGFRMKYFGVGCGVGELVHKTTSVSLIENGNPVQWSTTIGGCFLIQPSIRGFIPICDEEFFLPLNVGYNIVPSVKSLNGLTFGVGFYVNIDY